MGIADMNQIIWSYLIQLAGMENYALFLHEAFKKDWTIEQSFLLTISLLLILEYFLHSIDK